MSADPVNPLTLASSLVRASKIDTVYHDIYVRRARAHLESVLPSRERATLAALPAAIDRALAESHRAVERGDWARVRELAEEARSLKATLDGQRVPLALAAELYGAVAIPLDPFSPGLDRFVKGEARALRRSLVATLAELGAADPPVADFYRERRAHFAAMDLEAARTPVRGRDPAAVMQSALLAVAQGKVDQLLRCANEMLRRETSAPTPETAPETPDVESGSAVPFPAASVSRAGALGLAHVALPALPRVAHCARRFAWHSGSAGQHATTDGTTRSTADVRADELAELPAGVRDLLVQFSLHLYVTSGGTRFAPRGAAEEVLLEVFPEEAVPARSPLLEALALPRRSGLARTEIEGALLDRGADILESELRLDPCRFRLICVPPDVYAMVGLERGWGEREMWTHFDGYQVMLDGGVMRALVGGDVRYGGRLDWVSIARDDRREQVTARFAVVFRDRMGARWS